MDIEEDNTRRSAMTSESLPEAAGEMIRQIERYGIGDERVHDAMRAVPRHAFVPEHLQNKAYDDRPLPIGSGQTISQPYIVARMAELAQIGSAATVLDVGTGSGYGAAILSQLAATVVSIERHAELADAARERLLQLGYHNVEVHTGDGTQGWADETPYSAIVVAAAGRNVPSALRDQLAVNGRLVMPVGGSEFQTLQVLTKTAPHKFDTHDFESVAFVPLVADRA